MDTSIVGGEIHVGLEERAVGLVQFAGFDDLARDGVLAAIEKSLGERRQAGGATRVFDLELVKGQCDGCGGPHIDIDAALLLDIAEKLFFSGAHVLNQKFSFFPVKSDAAGGYSQ